MEDWVKGAIFVGGAAVLLIVILVPLSFHGVEYYEVSQSVASHLGLYLFTACSHLHFLPIH